MVLLNLLLVSIISYVATKGYSLVFAIKIIKDLMNRGYKLEAENMKDIIANMPEDMKTMDKIESYIPIWNFVKMLGLSYKFVKNKETIYDHLANMNIIVKMDDFDENDSTFDRFLKATSQDPEKASETIKAKAELKKTINDLKESKNNIKNETKKVKVLKEIDSLLTDYRAEIDKLRNVINSKNRNIDYQFKLSLIINEANDFMTNLSTEEDLDTLNNKKIFLITRLDEIKVIKKQMKNGSYVISDEERKKAINLTVDYALSLRDNSVEENDKAEYTDDNSDSLDTDIQNSHVKK